MLDNLLNVIRSCPQRDYKEYGFIVPIDEISKSLGITTFDQGSVLEQHLLALEKNGSIKIVRMNPDNVLPIGVIVNF